MKEIDLKIIQLKDQTWQIARESLDNGETRIYRSLTDIAERLTKLIGPSDESQVVNNQKAEMLPIFARYNGKRYEAELDVNRIDGGRGKCVLMEGEWWSTSGSAIYIKINSINFTKNPSTNGWRQFWKYKDESSNTEQPIDRLRRNN